MYQAATFDPNSAASGTFDTKLSIGGKFVAFNESNVGLNIIFSNGNTRYLSAWNSDKFTLPTASSKVTWSQKVTLLGNTNPISQCVIEAYQPNEPIEGIFPAPIQHTSYIPNTVSTAFGGSTTLQNDSSPSGTQFIESTVAGSPGSNMLAQVQGLFQILQWVGGSLTQIFKTDPGAASVVKLGNTGLTTESLGNMTVDQVLSVIGNTSLSTLSTSGKATLNSAEVQGNLQVDGTASFNSAGATIDSGSNFNGNATNTNTVNTGTVNATTVNSVTVNATGHITEANNQALQWKDSGGVARNVLNVDASNNTTLQGITGKDQLVLENAAGSIQFIVDAVLGLLKVPGTKQTLTGNTSGTFDIYEFLSGPIKIVIGVQTNYRDTNAFNAVTLKTAFATVAGILNFGCGGVLTGTGGVGDADNRQVTWGTGTAAGTQAACTGIASDAAGFTTHGFTQVGNNNYGSAHGGLVVFFGF